MPLYPSFPDIQTVAVTGSIITTAVQSGSYTVIVSGTQSITGTVGISGPVAVSNFPAVQAITGSVLALPTGVQTVNGTVTSVLTGTVQTAVTNFPATQTVTGSVAVGNQVSITGSVAVNNFPATQVIQGAVSVGNVVAITSTGSLPVSIMNIPTITGSVTVGNQVSITTTGSLPVTFSGIVNVTGTVLALPTGTQTVAGTVTSVITGTVMISTTGSAGLMVGNAPNRPLWIASTGSIAVIPQGTTTITGSVSIGNIVTISGSVSTQASFPTASGTMGSLNSTVTIASSNSRTVGGSIRGTWTGTIVSEGTVNGNDWFAVRTANKSTNDIVNSYTANDDFEFYSVAGCTQLRLRMSAYTSGLPQVTLVGTEAATAELLNYSGPDGDQVPPTRHLSIASINVDGTLRALNNSTSNVSGSEVGLITRSFQNEEASFLISIQNIAIGNSKSMVSVLNGGSSTKRLRVHSIWLTNVQNSNVTGIAAQFTISRITGHSAGTLVTANVIPLDTADVLNANVSIRTGGTISGRGTSFWKSTWSSDEWAPGSLDQEGFDHGLQAMFPILRFPNKIKPLTLRPGEGFDILQNVNSTVGTFDITILFSEVLV